MNEDSKPFWQSRTIIGAVVTIVALVAGMRHVKIDVANMTDLIMQGIAIVGSVYAIIGRFKATKPITFTGTAPGGPFNPNAEVRKAQTP